MYTALRAALDTGGHTDVDVFHVFTGDDSPLIKSAEPPLVTYRQDVERVTGTTGGGSLKVLRSNWPMVAYDQDLADALAYTSVIVSALTDAKLTTTDGYSTTNISPLGVMSLYETDSQLYAVHFRLEWERSK
jgi:hypothetical protein